MTNHTRDRNKYTTWLSEYMDMPLESLMNKIFEYTKTITPRELRYVFLCEAAKQLLQRHPWESVEIKLLAIMDMHTQSPKAYVPRAYRYEMYDLIKKYTDPLTTQKVRAQIPLAWVVDHECTEQHRPFATSLNKAFGYKGIILLAKEVVLENIDRTNLDRWIRIVQERRAKQHEIAFPLVRIAMDRKDNIGKAILASPTCSAVMLRAYILYKYVLPHTNPAVQFAHELEHKIGQQTEKLHESITEKDDPYNPKQILAKLSQNSHIPMDAIEKTLWKLEALKNIDASDNMLFMCMKQLGKTTSIDALDIPFELPDSP